MNPLTPEEAMQHRKFALRKLHDRILSLINTRLGEVVGGDAVSISLISCPEELQALILAEYKKAGWLCELRKDSVFIVRRPDALVGGKAVEPGEPSVIKL